MKLDDVSIGIAFHQQAADQLGGNLLGGVSEEVLGEGWEGFYGSGNGLMSEIAARNNRFARLASAPYEPKTNQDCYYSGYLHENAHEAKCSSRQGWGHNNLAGIRHDTNWLPTKNSKY